MADFNNVLTHIKKNTNNNTKRGNAFEKICKIFLENDPIQAQTYSKVWSYKDWAENQGLPSSQDDGVDLVAQFRDGDGFCAVQCKFHERAGTITKASMDSFIAASDGKQFKRRLLMDSTSTALAPNAQSALDRSSKPFSRLQRHDFSGSPISWGGFLQDEKVRLLPKRSLMPHQSTALKAVQKGLAAADQGKLIMACGTGKTFTSLKIAEKMAGAGKRVLYMVPSLSLMSQSIREWKNDAAKDFTAFSACSDVKVGRNKLSDDKIELSLSQLALPATTDAKKLAEKVNQADQQKMTVVFSTYHSIDVISSAQDKHKMGAFDLIICDEAHRTTGATLFGKDETNFVRIHQDKYVKGKKRLYMTATPRIYNTEVKAKAQDHDAALASMDDVSIYGEELYRLGFGDAVEKGLLADYKVIVLGIDEGVVSQRIQMAFKDGSELKLDDASKMVGCYRALAKVGLQDDATSEGKGKKLPPMRRALAFSKTIKASQNFSKNFMDVVSEYDDVTPAGAKNKTNLKVEVEHVDGGFDAAERNDRLFWLKSDDRKKDVCRVLSNVRCLSEGVDVPALDAAIFLHPRGSQIDIVQAVGRVMRKSEGKKLGYVILPVAVPAGMAPEKALDDNKRYKVVWQVLNALRSHDERFESIINQFRLGQDISDKVEVCIGSEIDGSGGAETQGEDAPPVGVVGPPTDIPGLFAEGVLAKIVQHCGTRDYWDKWAKDIADIAARHITRIKGVVSNPGSPAETVFMKFLEEVRDDLNPSVSKDEAIEMLAQHIITKPVFAALFQGHQFTKENAVSKAMEKVLKKLDEHNIDSESESLQKFYASVERRASGITSGKARQELVVQLYNQFFRDAFPLVAQKLGIVYTPVEVVDFIINSVDDVLQDEFKKSLGSKNVHILDPFTGTGTFITRLLQSGLISQKELSHKYKNEIHANEIVLLAYYIACINVESVYQDVMEEKEYQPFNGMILTDTFQLYEEGRDMVANLMPDNSGRRKAQKEREITVVIGNPPYSKGQNAGNDNAANVSYENLDKRIAGTYAKHSTARTRRSLYDSYIRAFRWASDRIKDEGVIAFVSGAGWIDGKEASGMRKCLREGFSKVYVFHLRGNANTSGQRRQKEKGNVFGGDSKTPIAITVLVKKQKHSGDAQIHFYDIGDYLSRVEKLSKIKGLKSVNRIKDDKRFSLISPDEEETWIGQGDKDFKKFIPIGNKKNPEYSVFEMYSCGTNTARDAWCYNYSLSKLRKNIESTIAFYNSEVQRIGDRGNAEKDVSRDSRKISWSSGLFEKARNRKTLSVAGGAFLQALYRPFTKTNMYYSKDLNHSRYQTPRIFSPNGELSVPCISVDANTKGNFSVLMTSVVPDYHYMGDVRCFPLKFIEKQPIRQGDLFEKKSAAQKDGISGKGFEYFQAAYLNQPFSKEDVFYYIYGLLHHPQYSKRFGDNLSRELPRIPTVKKFDDFMAFSKAGRELGVLHMDYEAVEPYPVTFERPIDDKKIADRKKFYRVEEMKFASNGKDKSTVIYNHDITIKGIPLKAYDYVVNKKSALGWIMERQQITTHEKSDIMNDPNDYANEIVGDPRYPLDLFCRVITVSLKTLEIVKGLPKLDID